MDDQLKKLLRDLQEREKTRKEELEKFDFQKAQFDSQIRKLAAAMKKDILDGLYKSTSEDELKQIIEDEKNKIRKKYNNENSELGNESRKKMERRHFQEKETDYKQISSAIKEYHIDMVLELNEARIFLDLLETNRKAELQKLDEKLAQKEAERNAQIQKIDKKIAEKQAEKVYEMVLNSDLDVETNTRIKILEEEIERLKGQKEFISDEEINQIKTQKEAIDGEYASKIEAQNKQLQYYSEQKDRAGKLIGQIRLSEKSINQIYEILFDEEKENQATENEEEEVEEQVNTELAENEEEAEEQVNTELAENEEEAEEQVKTELAENEEEAEEQVNTETIENENTQNNKFSYYFSIRRIYFDGKAIGIKQMLEWYAQNKKQIETQIKSVLMDEEEKVEDFLQNSDKLIYISMVFKSSNAPSYGSHLNDKAIEQLKEYYDIWANPEKEESNMDINWDLRGISWLWMSRKLSYREVQNIRDNAFKIKDRKNVTLDKITQTRFLIRKFMEKLKKSDNGEISDENKYRPKEIARKIGENVKSWMLTQEERLKANERRQSNNEQPSQNSQEADQIEEGQEY